MAFMTIIWGFLKNILGNWKVLIAIVVMALSFLVYLKINKINKNLEATKIELKIAVDTNKNLNNQIDRAVEINKSNALIIGQLQIDKKVSATIEKDLKLKIETNNKNFDNIRKKIDLLPSAPVSNIISSTVEEIQKLRDQRSKVQQ